LPEKGPTRPLIIPVFIPNQGCPHRCIFCQQETITAQSGRPVSANDVKGILDAAIGSTRFDTGRNPEVAFYGGTFTRLPRDKMADLLGAVRPYLERGIFKSIRISTRPDALDREGLDLLRRFGVSTVELGSQSMDDDVLALIKRGHRARDTVESVRLLRRHGFRVGIQLMPGLPGDTKERFLGTVEAVIRLHPDMVRLYPAVVIRGTEMASWYEDARYRPLGLEEAVDICGESCIRLEAHGIPVIRIGLMSSPTLLEEGQILAGPWHSAFGFLVRSGIHHRKIEPFLPRPGHARKIKVRAPRREVPLVRGYKNRGLELIEARTGARITAVEVDESLLPGHIGIDRM
jgi:histone acetyltransferase (RNA polymerase elongator complex component)